MAGTISNTATGIEYILTRTKVLGICIASEVFIEEVRLNFPRNDSFPREREVKLTLWFVPQTVRSRVVWLRHSSKKDRNIGWFTFLCLTDSPAALNKPAIRCRQMDARARVFIIIAAMKMFATLPCVLPRDCLSSTARQPLPTSRSGHGSVSSGLSCWWRQ